MTCATLRRAISQHGPEHQTMKAIEELGELTTELSRAMTAALRGEDPNRDAVISEIADCQIMLWQLRDLYGADVVDAEIAHKIKRLETRLSRDNSHSPGALASIRKVTDNICDKNTHP